MKLIIYMNQLSSSEQEALIQLLRTRFFDNPERHVWIDWEVIEARLHQYPEKLAILSGMENTGWEPDLVWYNESTDEYLYFDCSSESPKWRRSLCYDQAALDSRKENKPKSSVNEQAKSLGITLLTEEEYRYLQKLGTFDQKTSSWIYTPNEIRELGGALFCNRRYNQVFTYHNGADSYYAVRGFRWKIGL